MPVRVPVDWISVSSASGRLSGEVLHKIAHAVERNIAEQAVGGRIQNDRLPPYRHRMTQRLLEDLHQPFAVLERLLSVPVQIRAELGEYLQLAEAGKIDAQRTGGFLMALV